MPEFNGVRVVLVSGATRNFLPGLETPGVSCFTASESGVWLHVNAVCPGGDGYLAARFSHASVLYQEPLK
jgi:hypothetical protein